MNATDYTKLTNGAKKKSAQTQRDGKQCCNGRKYINEFLKTAKFLIKNHNSSLGNTLFSHIEF